MIKEELSILYDEFIKLARAKKYREVDIKMLGLLALTKDSVRIFGNTEESFIYLIEITKEHKTSQEALDKFTTKLGF